MVFAFLISDFIAAEIINFHISSFISKNLKRKVSSILSS